MKLHLKDVQKTYGSHRALDGLSLELETSRCLALIGPSGGGKSTTLRLIAGLEHPDSGDILVNGSPLPHSEEALREYRKTVGVVFQSFNLFPHLDALANIALPLEKVHGVAPEKASHRASELLERFQLGDHQHKKPAQLSGGQSQRVAIARSIAHDPQLILFDEPTSALDPEMSAEILDVIEELIQSGKDCVIVTHQMGFAKRASDHTALIANGQIVEHAPSATLFAAPKSLALQTFLARELRY